MCDNETYPGKYETEYPTDIYMYVDNETRCIGQGKTNFVFDGWLNNNSSLPSETLTIDRYGNFTAHFKPLPTQVTIPSDFLYGVVLGPTVGAILGGILGWYIPYLMNKRAGTH